MCLLRGTETLYCSIHTAQGPVMAQAVSHRPVMAEARFRSQVSLCEIGGCKVVVRQVFFPSTSVVSCQYQSAIAPYSFGLHAALTRRTNG